MLKVLHIADNHFKADRLSECVGCFDYIIQFAAENQPDLIIHAGDLFEKNTMINSLEFRAAVRGMMALANIATVFMIRGNHDPDNALNVFEKLETVHLICYSDMIQTVGFTEIYGKLENVKILSIPYISPSTIGSGDDIGEVHVSGAGYLKDKINRFIEHSAKPDTINLIVAHITVVGAELANSERILEGEIMLSPDDFDHKAIDGVLLGHIHKAQQDIFDGTNIRYSGAHYRTRFDEIGSPGFNFWKFHDNGKTEIEFIETPAREMHQYDFDEEETKKIMSTGELPFEIPNDADIKVVFSVPEGMSSMLDKEKIRSLCPGNSTLKLNTKTIPKVVVRSEKMADAKTDLDKLKEWGRVTNNKITKSIIDKFNLVVTVADE